MIIFFLLATLLIICTLWSIHSIWKYRRKDNLTLNNAEWQVMVAKRNEIENDILLPQDTQIALRNEWVYMADAVLSRNQESDNASHRSTVFVKKYNTYWILVPSIILALLIYSMLGNWNAPALKLHSSDLTVASSSNPDLPITHNSLEKLITQLENKLKESPNNLDGWVLLARSLGVKQDFAGASSALENALKLAPGHPDLLADLADMLAMTNNKSLAGRPTQLIQEALKSAPDHPKALSLAATSAMQKSSIEGRVILSSKLREMFSKTKLPENATLFIVAKSPSGPPMPLAVVRFPAQQLMDNQFIPFKLDDSQAMSPTLKLSGQTQVNLEARISMLGTAGKQAGDLYVALPDVRLGVKNLLLEIQSVL